MEPPYRLSDLAEASGLSKGYLSRALATLHDQGLIERRSSGPVEQVSWTELLRQRASEYDLLKSNTAGSYLARSGPKTVLQSLVGETDAIVTGSFAASRINPVAAPAQLALYVTNVRSFAQQHDLYPTKSGSNVLLLQPDSPSQLDRPRLVDGVLHAGYSQLVLDLLAGNGRLPEEGDAIMQWLIDNPGWRLPALPISHR